MNMLQLQVRIKKTEKRIEKLKDLQAPPVLLEKEKEWLEYLRNEYKRATLEE